MKTKPKHRTAVVGCGRIGSLFSQQTKITGVHSHAEAYAKHARSEFVGVCDSNPGRRRMASEQWGVTGYRTIEELMTKAKPSVVSICSPDELHAKQVLQIIEHKCIRAIFVEKPLATTLDDAVRMIRDCRRRGVSLSVNFTRRFSPAFQYLRSQFKQGRLGKLILARMLYGKGLLHNGSHALDLLNFILNEPFDVRHASACGFPGCLHSYDAEIRYRSGARAIFTAFPENVATVFEGDFLFERCRWEYKLGGTRWSWETKSEAMFAGFINYVATPFPQQERFFREPLKNCLSGAVDNVLRHIDDGRPLICSGEAGLEVMRQVDQIVQFA